jgi:cytochrome c oxidase assembly factor CtaG
MAPSRWSWFVSWAEVAILVAVVAGYLLALRLYPVSRARAAVGAGGLVLVAAALVSPVATISLHYLLAAHLLQNVILAEWAPALLVGGLAPALAARAGRVPAIRVATHPFCALPVWVATYAAWHVPAAYDAALRHPALLVLEHMTYLVAGGLFWWPVLQDSPHGLHSGQKATYLFGAFLLASPIGLLLTLLPDPIYSFYEAAPRLWGISPLEDQQLAGVIMSGSEAVVFFAAFSFYVLRFFAEEAG